MRYVIGGVIIGVVGSVIAAVLGEWAPIWARRVVAAAAERMPVAEPVRIRLREEYLAGLADMPVGFSQLGFALSLWFSAGRCAACNWIRRPDRMRDAVVKFGFGLFRLIEVPPAPPIGAIDRGGLLVWYWLNVGLIALSGPWMGAHRLVVNGAAGVVIGFLQIPLIVVIRWLSLKIERRR